MPAVRALTRAREWLRPWAWLPLLVLLSWQLSLSDMFRLSAPWLVLPLAAWLGHRYGRLGVAVVAIGGLGLPMDLHAELGFIPGYPDVFIAALLLAWLASEGDLLARLAWRPASLWKLPLLFALLAVVLGLWGREFGSGVTLRLILDFQVLLYLLLFALGLSRVALGPVIAALAIATVAGIVLESAPLPRDAAHWLGASQAYLPVLGLTDLHFVSAGYWLDRPAEFLAGTGYLLAGRLARDGDGSPLSGRRLWLVPTALGLGLLLALGDELNLWLINLFADPDYSGVTKLPHYARWLGADGALPPVALVAGMSLGYPGLVAALAGVVTMWGLEGWLRAGLAFAEIRPALTLAAPLYVFGFGALGVQIRARRQGRIVPWWSGAWAFYLLLTALVLQDLWPPQRPLDLLLLCAGFVLVLALSLGLARLWQWLEPQRQRHDGWVTLAALTLIILWVTDHSQEAWGLVLATVGQLRLLWRVVTGGPGGLVLNNSLLFATLVLLALGAAVHALGKLLQALPGFKRDLWVVYALLAGRLRVRDSAPVLPQSEPTPPAGTLAATGRWLGRLGWLGVVVALLQPAWVAVGELWSWVEKEQRRSAQRHEREENPAAYLAQAEQAVDPALLQAVRSFTQGWPTTKVEPSFRSVVLHIDWYAHPDYPGELLRIRIRVEAPRLDLRERSPRDLRDRALSLYVSRLERGRFNLWVEPNTTEHRERENALEAEMRATIIARADAADVPGSASDFEPQD